VAFARVGRLSEAREAVAGMGIAVMPLTETLAERAAELRASHERLRLPDAILLATAQHERGELLSYDRRLSLLADKHR
jgi:predicted nucleic acid-binding protein